jgi:ligand-binding SRPBCC domain-containing protein
MVHTLRRKQFLPHPITEVFRFFQSPENLARITPPWLHFQILTPLPIEMKHGTLIDYTIRWLGIPVRWMTMITDYAPPAKFVDQQLRGPYSLWHHTHTFIERDGGTEMTDVVQYVLPFGFFGNIAHSLIVQQQLDEIFSYRSKVIADMFPSLKPQSSPTSTRESRP